MFAGKKSAQIREILISESAWEEMTCLFAPSLIGGNATVIVNRGGEVICRETFSGKVSDKYSKLYEVEDTGIPVSVTSSSDCQFFKA